MHIKTLERSIHQNGVKVNVNGITSDGAVMNVHEYHIKVLTEKLLKKVSNWEGGVSVGEQNGEEEVHRLFRAETHIGRSG